MDTTVDDIFTVPGSTAAPAICDKFYTDYQIAPALLCGALFILGIIYTFLGYRFIKGTMFLTGFLFGATFTYMICLEEDLLPLLGKVGVAVTTGILCGLITMLVLYVGMFTTGLCSGILIAIGTLVVMEEFYHPTTKWVPIGMLFGLGLLIATLNLYFQRSLTIFGTALFGAAQMATAADYFIEDFMMVDYIRDRTKAEISKAPCWHSWLLLGFWPLLFFLGSILQFQCTAKNFTHEPVRRRRKRRVSLEHIRVKEAKAASKAEKEKKDLLSSPSDRYRHLYQVRRCNGDVISQSFIQKFQDNLTPATRNMVSSSSSKVNQIDESDSSQTEFTQLPNK